MYRLIKTQLETNTQQKFCNQVVKVTDIPYITPMG